MSHPDRPIPPSGLTYRDAGVDVEAGSELVRRIKPLAHSTARPGVMSSLGGFGALFELPLDRYRNPLLVSATDGVGTKLRLAIDLGIHDTVGIDLVAMCANDILTLGAEPLFFLDYYATGKLDLDVAEAVIAGIAAGCRLAGAALIGGETAEMPGMYRGSDFDLAGFCVGIVERDAVIDGSAVAPRQALIGLGSSGPHSNGYSLIRRVIEGWDASGPDPDDRRALLSRLLEPTRIYVSGIRPLVGAHTICALAHITGGGIIENVGRVIPPGLQARLHAKAWRTPSIFDWLQSTGRIPDREMHRTFNCGIGMVAVLPANQVDDAMALLSHHGEEAFVIGEITEAEASDPSVVVE